MTGFLILLRLPKNRNVGKNFQQWKFRVEWKVYNIAFFKVVFALQQWKYIVILFSFPFETSIHLFNCLAQMNADTFLFETFISIIIYTLWIVMCTALKCETAAKRKK